LEELKKVVALCRDVYPSGRVNPCVDGAFMEYNHRAMTLSELELFTEKPFSTQSVYDPCDYFEGPDRGACAFRLPHWWFAVLVRQQEDIFSVMGHYCEGIKDMETKDNCFRGLGFVAADGADFQFEGAKASCEQATSDKHNLLICKAYSIRRLHMAGNLSAGRYCEMADLSEAGEGYCYATVTVPSSRRDTILVPDI
jgi:hypothetical protein